jgi:predicted transcriptional regulator
MGKNKTIKEAVIRKFPAVTMEDTLETALKVMAKDNASALVVKAGDDLVGVVAIADIMYSLSNEDDLRQTKVASFMTSCEFITEKPTNNPCVQLDEDEGVLSAIKVMSEAGVNHLLVSGSKGEPVGMVSSLEIIKLLAS